MPNLRACRDRRGFPPDIAKRRLAKLCKADGHVSQPKYLVGMRFRPGTSATGDLT